MSLTDIDGPAVARASVAADCPSSAPLEVADHASMRDGSPSRGSRSGSLCSLLVGCGGAPQDRRDRFRHDLSGLLGGN